MSRARVTAGLAAVPPPNGLLAPSLQGRAWRRRRRLMIATRTGNGRDCPTNNPSVRARSACYYYYCCPIRAARCCIMSLKTRSFHEVFIIYNVYTIPGWSRLFFFFSFQTPAERRRKKKFEINLTDPSGRGRQKTL